ncbi:hypothetical protein FI667_g11134, partial [Globisporangium splendens]
MITTGNAKGCDALGRAVLWSSQGQQVMMQWEQQYMQTCVDALCIRRSDRVLEIGFGLAYSATHIQHFRPLRHTIIECDAAVIQDAEKFARSHEGVHVMRGTWQSLLPTLSESDQFDCVFFDDYPLPELEELGITQNQTRSLRTRDLTLIVIADGRSRWHDFLDAVLPHVTVGGRITGYLARDIDLHRRGCHVETSAAEVTASENCEYFPHKTALVPVITVLDHCASMTPGQHVHSDEDGPIFPRQASSKLREMVVSNSNASSNNSTRKVATSHRRIEDIRSVLQEQELLENDPLESESVEEASDVGDAIVQDSSHRYNDATSRKTYLAALRLKKRQASAPTAAPSAAIPPPPL